MLQRYTSQLLLILGFLLVSSAWALPSVKQLPYGPSYSYVYRDDYRIHGRWIGTCIDLSQLVDARTNMTGEIGGGLYFPTFSANQVRSPNGRVAFVSVYGDNNPSTTLLPNLGLYEGVPRSDDLALVAHRYDIGPVNQPQEISIDFDPPVRGVKVLAGTESAGLSFGDKPVPLRGRLIFESVGRTQIGAHETLYDLAADDLRDFRWYERKASQGRPIDRITITGGGGGTFLGGSAIIWGLCYQP